MNLIFPFIQAAPVAQDAYMLMNRALVAVVTILLAVCIYFLKQVADDIKTTRATVADHGRVLARHGVMYEMWLDELSTALKEENGAPAPKRRHTDLLRDMIGSIADSEVKRREEGKP